MELAEGGVHSWATRTSFGCEPTPRGFSKRSKSRFGWCAKQNPSLIRFQCCKVKNTGVSKKSNLQLAGLEGIWSYLVLSPEPLPARTDDTDRIPWVLC